MKGRFRASGALGNWVIGASALLVVSYWIAAALAPASDRRYERAVAAGESTDLLITGFDNATVLSFLATVLAWVLTGIWLSRVRGNADLLDRTGQRRSSAWVWLGWVVPIVRFWFPKQILDDVSRPTTAAAGHRPISTRWYWVAWLCSSIVSSIMFRSSGSAAPEDSVVPLLSLVNAALATIALVFWIPLVRRLSAAQDQLAATGPVPRPQG